MTKSTFYIIIPCKLLFMFSIQMKNKQDITPNWGHLKAQAYFSVLLRCTVVAFKTVSVFFTLLTLQCPTDFEKLENNMKHNSKGKYA